MMAHINFVIQIAMTLSSSFYSRGTKQRHNDRVDAAGDNCVTYKMSITSPLISLASNELLGFAMRLLHPLFGIDDLINGGFQRNQLFRVRDEILAFIDAA